MRRLQKKLTPYAQRMRDLWEADEPKYLSEGNSAAVFKLTSPSGDLALKIYDPAFFEEGNAAAEKTRVEAHARLQNHDCETLVEFDSAGLFEDTAYVAMEYLDQEDLAADLLAIPRDKITSIVSDVVKAALFLENCGLCHRDIKAENIISIKNYEKSKLLDLGVVRLIEEGGAGTDEGGRLPFIGTTQYASPEYLFRLVEPDADMWRALTFYQIGALLHDLIMQKPLFSDEKKTGNRFRIAYAVANTRPTIDASDVPKDLILLARDCLEKDMSRRLRLVTWARLTGEDVAALDVARARLNLKRSPASTPAPTGQVYVLEPLGNQLRQKIKDWLTEEGFEPPIVRVEANEQAAKLTITTSHPLENDAKRTLSTQFILTLCSDDKAKIEHLSENGAFEVVTFNISEIEDNEAVKNRFTEYTILHFSNIVD